MVAILFAAAFAPPPVKLSGHTDPVYAVAISADGKFAATGSFDKTLKLWDAATGKVLKTFAGPTGHTGLVLTAAFNPDGTVLASGGSDNVVKLWDVPAGTPAAEFKFGAAVTALAVRADGKGYAAAGANGVVRVFGPDGKQTHEFQGPPGPVAGVVLTPNHVAAACADRTLRFWPLNPGKDAAVAYGVGDAPTVWVGATGTQVFTAGADGTLRAWPAPAAAKTLGKVGPAFASRADGTAMVTVDADKKLRLLVGGTGATSGTIRLSVEPAAVAYTNAAVAVGFVDGTVAVYGQDGSTRLAATAVAAKVVAVALEEKLVLAGGADGSVTVAKVPAAGSKAKPEPPTKLGAPHAGGVTSLVFASATTAVSGGADGSVRLWDLAAKKEVKSFPAGPGKAYVASKGGVILIAAGNAVQLIAADGKVVKAALPATATGAAFEPEGKRIFVSTADGVLVLDPATLAAVFTLPAPGLTAFAPTPGAAMYTVAGGVLSFGPVPVVKAFAGPELARGVPAVRPNTGTLLAGGGKSYDLNDWNPATGAKNKFVTIAGLVARVVPARGANLFAAVKDDGKEVAVLAADGQGIGTFPTPAGVADAAFHPTAAVLAVAAGNTVSFVSVAGPPGQSPPPEFGRTLQSFPHPAAVAAVAVLADGTLLTAAADGVLRTWKPASETPRTIQLNASVDCVAWSPDGKTLAACGHDGTVKLFDSVKLAASKVIKVSTEAEPKPVYAVAWSPDGKQVATAGFDKAVKLWDAAEGKLVRDFPGHEDGVFAVAFSPDGKLLATGGADRRVKLWDAAAGKLLRDCVNPAYSPVSPSSVPPSHPGFVHAVRFSADGSKLISAGTGPRFQGYLATWAVADGKLLTGENSAFGPIYSVAPFADGRLLLGCGPTARGVPASDAVILPGAAK